MKSIIASTLIILVDEKQTILTSAKVSQSVEAWSTISWSAYQNFCTMERLSQIYVDRRMRYVSSVWILECDEWYVSSDFLITFTSIFFPATLNLAQAFYGSTAFNYPASSSPTPITKFSNVTLKICNKFISLRKFTPIYMWVIGTTKSVRLKGPEKETNSFRGLPFAT